MNVRFSLKYNDGAVEMTKPGSTMLIYKIPYINLKAHKPGFMIQNQFVVYILFGANPHGRDLIYVGKSKNGIDARPTAHEDKYKEWTTCYVLTQFKELTFFNDGTIQYIEDVINHRVNEVGLYKNTTLNTTSGTANNNDQEDCEAYLKEAYTMLNILGLDLITNSEEEEAEEDIESHSTWAEDLKKVPDGIYSFARKVKRLNNRELHGKMQVKGGEYILLAGSEVAIEAQQNLNPMIDEKRNSANIENGILLENVDLKTPSGCGEFIIGAACNGWLYWKNDKGEAIDKYRTWNIERLKHKDKLERNQDKTLSDHKGICIDLHSPK